MHVAFKLLTTPTIGTGSGLFQITGMPTAAATSQQEGGAMMACEGITYPAGRTQLSLYFDNVNTLGLAGSGSGVNISSVVATNLASGTPIVVRGSIIYAI
jgi:hypothetical protein